VNNASTAFTVQLDAIPTAACVVTPNDSSGGGVFSPTSRTISDAASYTFTYTPGTVGTKTIGVTHTGGGFSGNPASVTYTSTPQTLAVGPSAITTSGTTTVTWTGGGTFWTSSAPTFTPTGVAGVSVGSVTVTSDTSASATVTTGPTGGTITWTDSTTSATATQIVAIVEHALSTGQGFPSGLTDIGYAVYRIDGSGPLAAWTSVDVYELAPGAGDYGADVSYPADGSDYRITWSRGNATTPPYAHDVVSSIPVPPTTAEIAQAVLTNTTFLTTVGSLGGLVVAIDAKTTNLPASPAATGGQMVLSASGLDLIASGDPGPIASQTTFPKKLMALYRRFFGPSSLNTQLKTYADNGTTVNSTQAVTDDGTTQTYGKAT
jgi:hypothetical protein